jgi:hypothetical protein
MSYVSRILVPGESIVYFGRVHPIMYLSGVMLLLGSLAIMFYAHDIGKSFGGASMVTYIEYFSIALFMYGTYRLIKAWCVVTHTELVVTNKRVIAKFGFVNTTTLEMDRRKIAGVVISQGAWGHVFGYGRITLQGFSGYIGGLPVISKPKQIHEFLTPNI